MAQHGTESAYARGCHCTECKAAHAAYMREWSAKNRDKVAATAARRWRQLTDEQREARRAYMREYIRSHPEQQQRRRERKWEWRAEPENRAYEAAQARVLRSSDPERVALNSRRHLLKKLYGLTLEEFDAMAAAQGGCAICKGPPTVGKHKYFHVDHDHETGQVRGLLCSRCNTALGLFQERPGVLLAAVEYLAKHRG